MVEAILLDCYVLFTDMWLIMLLIETIHCLIIVYRNTWLGNTIINFVIKHICCT